MNNTGCNLDAKEVKIGEHVIDLSPNLHSGGR